MMALCGQVMTIVEAAQDNDWAEVTRLTAAGPSLNPPQFVRLSSGPFMPQLRSSGFRATVSGVLEHIDINHGLEGQHSFCGQFG